MQDVELEDFKIKLESPSFGGSHSQASLNTISEQLTDGRNGGQYVTALKDLLNVVQNFKDDYEELADVLGDIQTKEYHPLCKEILEGNVEQVENWIRTTKIQRGNLDDTDCMGLNALHYAIIFKKAWLVKLLLEAGADLTTPATFLGFLPLQLAIIGPEPFVDAIDLLCPTFAPEENDPFYSKKDLVNYFIEDSDLGTALELAVYTRNEKAAEILIKKGAKPSHCWRGRTCLERAIERREKNITEIMLKINSSKINMDALKMIKCCRSDNDSSKKHGHSPFNALIAAFPDIALSVMDQCIDTRHAPHEENYEIIYDVSIFENEDSTTNKCYRGLPCTCCFDLIGLNKKQNDDLESGGLCHLSKNYYESFDKQHHPLYHVMQTDDCQLLRHPVVQALLKNKLSKFFWFLYFLNFSSFLLLFIFLVTFILFVPNPRTEKCLMLRAGNISIQGSKGVNCSVVISATVNEVLLSFKILALSFILVRAILEAYQLYNQKILNYVLNWVNWLEIAQCLSTTIFLFRVTEDECFCPSTLEWQAGIISLAISSLVLILWTETLPLIGIYVIIMKKIVFSFLKVASFGLLLIIAFGLAFYMMFYRPPNEGVNFGTYSHPIRAILAIIPLTAGDISIDSAFYSEGQRFSQTYEALAFTIWLSCVIIMSVLFNNMLVGLAVGEVKEVTDEARITEIKLRIDLVLTLEENLPEIIHKAIIRKEPIIVKPNISKLKQNLKKALRGCCLVFSFFCFNLNHVRFWYWFSYQQPEQKGSVEQVKNIVERTGHYRSVKESDSKPATENEVYRMMDDLKRELDF